jgi:hypothetical protein
MKNPSYILILAVLLAASAISSCRKGNTADLATVSDATNVGLHMDAMAEDATDVTGKWTSLSGVTSANDSVPGATIDTSQADSGIFTVTYDGHTTVDSRFIRSGSMTLRLSNYPTMHWNSAGAILNITCNALKYTNTASGASFIYNGAHALTNITGGLSYQVLASATSIPYVQYRHTSSAASVTFSDGITEIWNINRLRTYTNTGGTPVIGVSADQTEGGFTYVEMWGTNRQGNQFYNTIITPTAFNKTTCNTDFRDPMTGESRQFVQGFNIEMTFGVASSGTASNLCPYGYQTGYTNSAGKNLYSVIQYWY